MKTTTQVGDGEEYEQSLLLSRHISPDFSFPPANIPTIKTLQMYLIKYNNTRLTIRYWKCNEPRLCVKKNEVNLNASAEEKAGRWKERSA